MRRILILNRLGIGDVVVTTPLAKLIKSNIEAKVGFVVADKSADLLINHDYIDDVFAYRKKNKHDVIAEIVEKRYNEAIIVDGRFSSTMMAMRAGCKLLNKGFEISLGANRLFKRKPHKIRAVEDFAAYIELVCPGLRDYEISAILGNPDAGRREYIENWLEEQKKTSKQLVLMIPKSAALNKNWPKEYFGQINCYLNEKGIIPVYIASKNDAAYIDTIAGEKLNAAGLFSLRELPTLAKQATFAVSVCTGPMHIMSTAGLPIIILYGPSDPVRWAPSNAIIVQSKLPCVPCERLDCTQKNGQTCMEGILPEEVIDVIEKQKWI